MDSIKTLIAFPFGLLSETFARIALIIQPDLDVDFNYLAKEDKFKIKKIYIRDTPKGNKKSKGKPI